MTKEKQILMLEVAYDLIQKVHHESCVCTTKNEKFIDDSFDVLRRILLLKRELKGGKKND